MQPSTRSRLKILHFVSGDLWAGAETMACNLLKRLKDYRNLDPSVILFNDGRLADELRGSGLTVHVIDESRHSFREILRKIRHIIGSAPPDIIHSHRYKENILALLISGWCRGIGLVSTQHGLPEYHNRNTGISQRFKTWANFVVLSRFFTTVAVSEDIQNVLVNLFGFKKEKVEVIRNGIEMPTLTTPQRKAGPFVIGSSGRLFPVKDYPFMVEIARTMATTNTQNVHFELAGEGPERPVLDSMVQHYGLQNIFAMKGHQDNMDTFFYGIDLYLNTSIHEGIPMSILEALARGIPVVAPAVGGINEIITNGVEGFLIEDRNPDTFTEKCLLLRENKELREKMSKAARDRADQFFSADRMAENYYRLYCDTAPQARQWKGSGTVNRAR